MTREEAIKIVNELQDTYIKYHGEEDAIEVLIDSVDVEALDMAIKALEQDTVSKESYDHEYFLRRKMEAEIDHLRRYISKLETQITLEQEPTTKNDLGIDCIDRKATLDAIIKRLGIKNEAYLLEAERVIYQQILAMPSVTPQEPRWIPVSERLPEGYGEYLITWKNPKYPKSYIGICECEITDVYDYEHNRFEVKWLFDGYITTAYPDSYVVAWMPLPTLYEPQGSEEKG